MSYIYKGGKLRSLEDAIEELREELEEFGEDHLFDSQADELTDSWERAADQSFNSAESSIKDLKAKYQGGKVPFSVLEELRDTICRQPLFIDVILEFRSNSMDIIATMPHDSYNWGGIAGKVMETSGIEGLVGSPDWIIFK